MSGISLSTLQDFGSTMSVLDKMIARQFKDKINHGMRRISVVNYAPGTERLKDVSTDQESFKADVICSSPEIFHSWISKALDSLIDKIPDYSHTGEPRIHLRNEEGTIYVRLSAFIIPEADMIYDLWRTRLEKVVIALNDSDAPIWWRGFHAGVLAKRDGTKYVNPYSSSGDPDEYLEYEKGMQAVDALFDSLRGIE